MHSTTQRRERRYAIVALIFAGIAVMTSIYAVEIARGAIPFTRASWLVGEDIAPMGAIAVAIGAALHAACAIGLWCGKSWSRWLAIALLAFGVFEQIPAISTMEWLWWPVVRETTLVIVRMVLLQRLLRRAEEPVSLGLK